MKHKRAPAAVHSKKPDQLGRTKNRRHGTRDWTNWDGTPRITSVRRAGRRNGKIDVP